MRDRMAMAYHAALEAVRAPGSHSVRIHVGSNVEDYLKSLLSEDDGGFPARGPLTVTAQFGGVPLIFEREWADDKIVVRSDVVIP